MANGLLGKAALVASTFTTIGQVGAGLTGTINVRVINRSTTTAMTIQLALCPSGYVDGTTPANADFIEPIQLEIPPSGILEDIALAVSSLEKVVAWASTGNCTVRAFGYLR